MGYVNKFNRGIAMVQEELQENGNDCAVFDVSKITVFSVIVNANAKSNQQTGTNRDQEEKTTPMGEKTTPMGEETTPMREETTLKSDQKTTLKILNAITENPYIKRHELSSMLNISLNGIKWQLAKLKEQGILKREGSNRNGKWVVVK